MALGSTHPLLKMSTSDIFWRGEGGKAVRADFLEILVDPTSWSPNGLSRPLIR